MESYLFAKPGDLDMYISNALVQCALVQPHGSRSYQRTLSLPLLPGPTTLNRCAVVCVSQYSESKCARMALPHPGASPFADAGCLPEMPLNTFHNQHCPNSFSGLVRRGYALGDAHRLAEECRRNPEAPDYMGDMNPFWQSLDQVFGAYFNATVPESSSDYTSFFHPVSPVVPATIPDCVQSPDTETVASVLACLLAM